MFHLDTDGISNYIIVYKSPQADMGYDIADYKVIDPIYGSLEDVDDLITELKKRDMKLMMDLVVNHTSEMVRLWFPVFHSPSLLCTNSCPSIILCHFLIEIYLFFD